MIVDKGLKEKIECIEKDDERQLKFLKLASNQFVARFGPYFLETGSLLPEKFWIYLHSLTKSCALRHETKKKDREFRRTNIWEYNLTIVDIIYFPCNFRIVLFKTVATIWKNFSKYMSIHLSDQINWVFQQKTLWNFDKINVSIIFGKNRTMFLHNMEKNGEKHLLLNQLKFFTMSNEETFNGYSKTKNFRKVTEMDSILRIFGTIISKMQKQNIQNVI